MQRRRERRRLAASGPDDRVTVLPHHAGPGITSRGREGVPAAGQRSPLNVRHQVRDTFATQLTAGLETCRPVTRAAISDRTGEPGLMAALRFPRAEDGEVTPTRWPRPATRETRLVARRAAGQEMKGPSGRRGLGGALRFRAWPASTAARTGGTARPAAGARHQPAPR